MLDRISGITLSFAGNLLSHVPDSALTLGTGMSICLTEIGAALGSLSMVTGIAVGLAGLSLAALAYPLYNRVLKTQRAKIAPNILRISDELLQG
jgi:hypothetical protein